MKFELEEVEQAILKQLNKDDITYYDIVACRDKGELLNIISIINSVIKKFNVTFELDKFLLDEYLLLKSPNNIKLIITNFYMQLISEE